MPPCSPKMEIRTGRPTTQSYTVTLGAVGFIPAEPPGSVCRSILPIRSIWWLVLPRVVPKTAPPARRWGPSVPASP